MTYLAHISVCSLYVDNNDSRAGSKKGPSGRGKNSDSSNWVGISSYAGQWRDGQRHGAGVCYYNDNHIASVGADKDKGSEKDNGSDQDKDKDKGSNKDKGSEKDTEKDKGLVNAANNNNYARYAGVWSANKFDGKGVLVWVGGDHYTGDFVQGLMHGTGVWYHRIGSPSSSDGDCWYEGEFREGMYEGQGVLKKRHGKGWVNDKGRVNDKSSKKDKNDATSEVYGIGVPTSFILVYEGAWLRGKRHGYGVEYWPPTDNSKDDGTGRVQQQVRYSIRPLTPSTHLINLSSITHCQHAFYTPYQSTSNAPHPPPPHPPPPYQDTKDTGVRTARWPVSPCLDGALSCDLATPSTPTPSTHPHPIKIQRTLA